MTKEGITIPDGLELPKDWIPLYSWFQVFYKQQLDFLNSNAWQTWFVAGNGTGKTHIIWKKSLGINSSKAIMLSHNKNLVYQILKKVNLPVLPQIVINKIDDYQKKVNKITFPQVIKPLYGEKGKNIYLNISLLYD